MNNRRAKAGDYLWVFSLPDGNCVRQMDDTTAQVWEEPALKSFHALDHRTNDENFIRDFIVATGWKDGNDLELQIIGSYNLTPGKIYARFEYTATYRVIGTTFGFITSESKKLK